MITTLFDSEWFVLIYVVILCFVLFAGIFAARKLDTGNSGDLVSKNLLGSIISFFSLLLAFTLSSSASSNKERTNLLHEHTDLIGELYRRSFVFDDSLRGSIKNYVIECLELKIESSGLHGDARKEVDKKSDLLNEKYHRQITQLARLNNRYHDEIMGISEQLGKIIVLDNRIHYNNHERTPAGVMLLLLLSSWTVSFLIGISGTSFKKHFFLSPVILIVLTTLTVLVIQDMDNPHTGFIKPPYEIYDQLLEDVKSEN